LDKNKNYGGLIYKATPAGYEAAEGKEFHLLAVSEPTAEGLVECLPILRDAEDSSIPLPPRTLPYDAFIDVRRRLLVPVSSFRGAVAHADAGFLEAVLKSVVLHDVVRYYEMVRQPQEQVPFLPGKSRVPYAGRIYDRRELLNLTDASLEFYLTSGRFDRQFCDKFASFLGGTNKETHVLTVNSGSSANLLAVTALTSPKLGDLRLRPGHEVVTVAATFPTNITPILQNGLVPVFVDIELPTLNVDPSLIESAITEKTRAIFLAHSLGIPFEADRILEIAEKHSLWVIEDNCDALGATCDLAREYRLLKGKRSSGPVHTGLLGHIGTSSFYPAHQMTMGEGGAVYTTDSELYRILLSLRDWGRDCWCQPGQDNTCGKRLAWKMGALPEGYDHKYVYSHLGYNMKITDLQAAIGCAQIEKLPDFISKRVENWRYLRKSLEDLQEIFILPCHPSKATLSPFGFALTLSEEARFSRNELINFLEEAGIQTRPLFAGNMTRQPALLETDRAFRVSGSLGRTDEAMKRTFWIGVYPGMRKEMLDYVIGKVRAFVSGR